MLWKLNGLPSTYGIRLVIVQSNPQAGLCQRFNESLNKCAEIYFI